MHINACASLIHHLHDQVSFLLRIFLLHPLLRASPRRLSNSVTRWTISWETTSVAGVSGASCAVCRNQSKRIAIGVRMAKSLHWASTVCRKRSSMPQPVFKTLWKSSRSHRHLYHWTRSQASWVFSTDTVVTSNHSNGSVPVGGCGSHTRSTQAVISDELSFT